MIEEDDDCSEDYEISQNSPKSFNYEMEESTLITDFSSPLKCGMDEIAESSSPEINFHKYNYFNKLGIKRKRSASRRSLCNSVKRPSLNISISKRSSPNLSNKGFHNEEEAFLSSSGCNMTSDDRSYYSSIEHKIEESVEEGRVEHIEDNVEDVNSEKIQIDENFEDFETTILDRTSNISSPAAIDENLPCGTNDPAISSFSVKEIQTADLPEPSSTKPPKIKRGTLLERAFRVETLIKKEIALYSHELNVGLRSSSGSFVSDILIVKEIHNKETFVILRCILEVYDSNGVDNDKTVFIYTAKSLSSVLQENSCIVVHFPVIAMLDLYLNCHFVFANERVQLISRNQISHSGDNLIIFRNKKLNISYELSKFTNTGVFRSLKGRLSKRVLDAVVGNPLFLHHHLQLKVLYLYSIRLNDANYYRLLSTDLENQICIIQLKEGEQKDVLNILHSGHHYIFFGFNMSQCVCIDRELQTIIENHSEIACKQDFIYIMEPEVRNWQVNIQN